MLISSLCQRQVSLSGTEGRQTSDQNLTENMAYGAQLSSLHPPRLQEWDSVSDFIHRARTDLGARQPRGRDGGNTWDSGFRHIGV